eukprot:1387904-Amorphochlora_amoeboformis.AAC.2
MMILKQDALRQEEEQRRISKKRAKCGGMLHSVKLGGYIHLTHKTERGGEEERKGKREEGKKRGREKERKERREEEIKRFSQNRLK